MHVTRRTLMTLAPIGVFAGLAPDRVCAQEKPAATGGAAAELYPSHAPELAREMVGASHAKLDRVRELLAQSPALANAAWDWGFGDWETALGAASHTGQREIAALLIEHGARPDLFTFAMLGRLDVVRAYVQAQPGIQRIHGPHGITLLKHARAGGDAALAVVEYLTALGDADPAYVTVPLSDEQAQRYIGEYSYGPGVDQRFAMLRSRQGDLSIRRGTDGSLRKLFHFGEHTFHPAGAPRVSIRFAVGEGPATQLTIIDGPSTVTARRV